MKVGIPREVKNHEYRVAITPAGVLELTRHGHEVFVEHDAGAVEHGFLGEDGGFDADGEGDGIAGARVDSVFRIFVHQMNGGEIGVVVQICNHHADDFGIKRF